MNTNVLEIIALLIKKMLNDDELFLEEEEIIEELLELGYDLMDIDQAFELIYNTTDIIEAENYHVDSAKLFYNRVFTLAEKMYLSRETQGLIRKIIFLNLLNLNEIEELIIRSIQSSYNGHTSLSDIWQILGEIIVDDSKLETLISELSEFEQILTDDNNYIN